MERAKQGAATRTAAIAGEPAIPLVERHSSLASSALPGTFETLHVTISAFKQYPEFCILIPRSLCYSFIAFPRRQHPAGNPYVCIPYPLSHLKAYWCLSGQLIPTTTVPLKF